MRYLNINLIFSDYMINSRDNFIINIIILISKILYKFKSTFNIKCIIFIFKNILKRVGVGKSYFRGRGRGVGVGVGVLGLPKTLYPTPSPFYIPEIFINEQSEFKYLLLELSYIKSI